MLWRRRCALMPGMVARTVRLNRPPYRPKPKRIVAVILRGGKVLDSSEYSLKPFTNWTNKSSGLLFFRKPINTAGLTVLFEA